MATKLLSLFEQINRIEEEGDDVIFMLMEEIGQDESDAVGFRRNSQSTQDGQDRILRTYEKFLCLCKWID
jgi:hypothetical protein